MVTFALIIPLFAYYYDLRKLNMAQENLNLAMTFKLAMT